MITPAQAEVLAIRHMKEYVRECRCETPTELADVLMKAVSVLGVAMVGAVGQPDAAARLTATTQYVAELRIVGPFQRKRAH